MKTARKKTAKKSANESELDALPSLSDRERMHYQTIRELEEECEKLEDEFKDHKATASAAKAAWEAAVSQLRATIRSGPDAQLDLKFAPVVTSDDFLGMDLEDALPKLTSNQIDKLNEAGVFNVGQLDQLRAGAGLCSIEGFGQATADKIEDMVLDFIAAERRKADAAADDGDEDDDQGDDDEDEGGDE